MWWYLIPAITAFLSLAVIAAVLRRAFPRLIVIDVSTISREREAERKRQIVLERAERLRASLYARLRKILRPLLAAWKEWIQLWYRRAVELERKHRRLGALRSEPMIVSDRARGLIEEGRVLLQAGSVRAGEQKLIEAISLSPKDNRPYEELGRLYIKERQWTEAAEAFSFLLKLDPKDASAHADLGELELARGEPALAVAHLQRAVELKALNPRLISLLLEAAIQSGNKELSLKTYARLKEVAPQYPSLKDFEERIRRM